MLERLLTGRRYWLLFGVITSLMLVLSYYGQIVYQYPIPPGDDIFNHLRAMENLQQNPTLWQWGGYPIGFRNLIVWLANGFANGDLIATLKVVWPLLPVLSSLAIWLVASKLFSKRIGLLALVIYGLTSLQPLQTLYDGGLPNVFAGNTLLPLALLLWAGLWRALKAPSKKLYWLLAGFLALTFVIFYTHHLSTIVLAATVLLSLPLLAIQAYKTAVSPTQKRAVYLLIGLFALTVLAVVLTPLSQTIADLVEVVKTYRQPTPPWEWYRYHTSINGLLFQAGLAGAVLLGWRSVKGFLTAHPLRIVLLVWFLFYLIGSRLSFVAEPERLARDLAMPGAILAGYFIVNAYHYLARERVIKTVFVTVIGLALALGILVKAREMTDYNTLVRYSTADVSLHQEITSGSKNIVALNSHTPAWRYLARPLISSKRVRLISDTSSVNYYLNLGRCVYLEVYKPNVWPEHYRQNQIFDGLSEDPAELTIRVAQEDGLKYWYEVCPK